MWLGYTYTADPKIIDAERRIRCQVCIDIEILLIWLGVKKGPALAMSLCGRFFPTDKMRIHVRSDGTALYLGGVIGPVVSEIVLPEEPFVEEVSMNVVDGDVQTSAQGRSPKIPYFPDAILECD